MKDQKKDDILEVRTYVRNKASRIETREIALSTPAGKKNFKRLSRAPTCTDRAETWTNVSGRASCARAVGVLPKSALYEEKSWQKYETLTNIRIHILENTE